VDVRDGLCGSIGNTPLVKLRKASELTGCTILLFDLLDEERLGGSSGINVAGAVRLAHDLGPGHTIVTILADYGTRYQSKLWNPEFLRGKGLPTPRWLE
jgi:cysteine synthase